MSSMAEAAAAKARNREARMAAAGGSPSANVINAKITEFKNMLIAAKGLGNDKKMGVYGSIKQSIKNANLTNDQKTNLRTRLIESANFNNFRSPANFNNLPQVRRRVHGA